MGRIRTLQYELWRTDNLLRKGKIRAEWSGCILIQSNGQKPDRISQ